MAQLIQAYHSTAFALSASYRFIRLLQQNKVDESVINDIQAGYNLLEDKSKLTVAAKKLRTTKFDFCILADTLCDDVIRDLAKDCNSLDRKDPKNQVFIKLFPSGNFSSIVKMNMEQEPAEIRKLIERVESLGETHSLYKYVGLLNQAVQKCETAIAEYIASGNSYGIVKAQEDIAKANLCRIYSKCYHDLSNLYGKTYVNRLFPQLKSSKGVEEPETESTNE